MDPISQYILDHRGIANAFARGVVWPLCWADGSKLSVQATDWHYCSPKTNEGPWSSFEVGPADHTVFPELTGLRCGDQDDVDDVHGWVPLEIILKIIERKGKPTNAR